MAGLNEIGVIMEKICKECGKKFMAKKSFQVFCHKNCKARHGYRANSRKAEQKTCQWCGDAFYPKKRGNEQFFCSRKCGAKGRGGPTKKTESGATCSFCGKQVHRKPYLVNKSKVFFCDRNCFAEYKKRDMNGTGNPNYRNLQPKACIGCGKGFIAYDKKRKYCSAECSCVNAASEAIVNLRKGYRAEKECQKLLQKEGYQTCRSAGSRGEYDVIAVSNNDILLVQVKSTDSEQRGRIFNKKALERLKRAHCPPGENVKKQMRTLVKGKRWETIEV